MEIIDLIIKALKEKNIDQKHADRIQKAFKVEKEEDIAAAIDSFTQIILPVIAEVQSKSKKDAEEAAKKAAIEAYEKQHGIKDGKPVEPKTEVKLDGLDPNVRALIENQNLQISELTKAVTGMISSQTKSQKLELVRSKMKGKIDDDFLEEFATRVNLETDNLDAEIESQVSSYTKLQQKFINKAVENGNYEPIVGGVSDADFDGFLKAKKDESPAFKGVEI